MKRVIATASICFFFAGCVGMPGMPGTVYEKKSAFDNAVEISMEPAWVGSSGFKLAVFWRSTMAESELILDCVIKGTHSIASGKSLKFNVDGEIVALETIDELTDFTFTSGYASGYTYSPGSTWSTKRYRVERATIDKILAGHKVIARINLAKTYIEGDLNEYAMPAAGDALRAALARIDTLKHP